MAAPPFPREEPRTPDPFGEQNLPRHTGFQTTPAPSAPTGVQSPSQRLVEILRTSGALTHVQPRGMFQAQIATAVTVDTSGDLIATIDALLNAGVAPESVADAAGQVPGGTTAFAKVAGTHDLDAQAYYTGIQRTGVNLFMVVTDQNGDEQHIPIGPGSIVSDSAIGTGIVYLDSDKRGVLGIAGRTVGEGQTAEVVWQDPDTGAYGVPRTVKIFFADTPDATKVNAALDLGLSSPADPASGVPASEAEILQMIEAAGAPTDAYGMSETTPLPTRQVPTWYDPSGVMTVPPVFGDTAVSAQSLVDGMEFPQIQSLQQAMIDSGWAPPGAVADGYWVGQWLDYALFPMAYANTHGLVLSDRFAFNNPMITPPPEGSRGYGMLEQSTSNAELGFRASLEAIGAQRANIHQTIPAYIPPIRRVTDPRDMEMLLQNAAQSWIGRKIDSIQMGQLAKYLEREYRREEGFSMIEAERQQLIEAGAADPNANFDLTPHQRTVLGITELPAVDENTALRRLNEYFKRMFANDYAQMAQRAQFRGAQARQGNLNQTVFSAISAGVGGG